MVEVSRELQISGVISNSSVADSENTGSLQSLQVKHASTFN